MQKLKIKKAKSVRARPVKVVVRLGFSVAVDTGSALQALNDIVLVLNGIDTDLLDTKNKVKVTYSSVELVGTSKECED